MRVRGLKLIGLTDQDFDFGSHPMRVRGLKHVLQVTYPFPSYVAPHAGAWIETIAFAYDCVPSVSHPMRVRGLKQNKRPMEGARG